MMPVTSELAWAKAAAHAKTKKSGNSRYLYFAVLM
jgi:hypothetical protein